MPYYLIAYRFRPAPTAKKLTRNALLSRHPLEWLANRSGDAIHGPADRWQTPPHAGREEIRYAYALLWFHELTAEEWVIALRTHPEAASALDEGRADGVEL